jgi:hypothetical protein
MNTAAQVLALRGVAHERPQRVVLEIFGDVVVRAELHRLNGGLDLADRGDHHDLEHGVLLFGDAQEVEPTHAGQADVEEHEIDVALAQDVEAGLGRRDRLHGVVALEDRFERIAHPLVVIDDEQGLRRRRHFGGVLLL